VSGVCAHDRGELARDHDQFTRVAVAQVRDEADEFADAAAAAVEVERT
jgi:hypothetical protein